MVALDLWINIFQSKKSFIIWVRRVKLKIVMRKPTCNADTITKKNFPYTHGEYSFGSHELSNVSEKCAKSICSYQTIEDLVLKDFSVEKTMVLIQYAEERLSNKIDIIRSFSIVFLW